MVKENNLKKTGNYEKQKRQQKHLQAGGTVIKLKSLSKESGRNYPYSIKLKKTIPIIIIIVIILIVQITRKINSHFSLQLKLSESSRSKDFNIGLD